MSFNVCIEQENQIFQVPSPNVTLYKIFPPTKGKNRFL